MSNSGWFNRFAFSRARKAASSGTGYTITGLGTNFAATPEAATGNRIYVAEAITPAVAATDYVTLFPWVDASEEHHFLAFNVLC